MVLVDPLQRDLLRRSGQLDRHLCLLGGQVEVFHLLPDQHHLDAVPALESRHADLPVHRLSRQDIPLVPGLGQHLKGVKDRLRDPVDRLHAETAVKLVGEGVQLLKDIREAPDAGAGHIVLDVEGRLGVIGRNLAGIVGVGGKTGVFVPFGVENRQALRLLLDDRGVVFEDIVCNIARLRAVGHDHPEPFEEAAALAGQRIELPHLRQIKHRLFRLTDAGNGHRHRLVVRAAVVLDAAQRVARILVGGDKIQRHIFLFAPADKGRDPFAAGGGGSADHQPVVDRFDRPGGDLIEVEVVGLAAVEEHSLQVRLVPDLEVPALDLLPAVPADQEADKVADICTPLVFILRQRDAGFIEEHTSGIGFGHMLRHKAQLDKGLDAAFEQVVVDQSAVVEALFDKPLGAGQAHLVAQRVVGVHIVVENAVEPHPLDIQLVVDKLQLLDIVGAHRHGRVAAADAKLPVLFKGLGLPVCCQRKFHIKNRPLSLPHSPRGRLVFSVLYHFLHENTSSFPGRIVGFKVFI